MPQIFISYVEEDGAHAELLARGLEQAGLSTWYYERDSLPGLNYLNQTGEAIEQAAVFLLLISPHSVKSPQVTVEVVRAHESGRPFIPLLLGLTHAEFQRLQPAWRQALGAAASVRVPADGIAVILPRIIGGLSALGLRPAAAPTTASSAPKPEPSPAVPETGARRGSPDPAASAHVAIRWRLLADRTAYARNDDPLARFLLQFEAERIGTAAAVPAAADLFLVLDVSGSMNRPDRYPLLRRAVPELVRQLGPRDRIGLALFSDGVDLLLPPTPGTQVVRDLDALLRRMDSSPRTFGPATHLAPGLRAAADALVRLEAAGPCRVYVLTDGEIHDEADCAGPLAQLRTRRVEVHVYGLGDGFSAAALKRLMDGQLGGSVKPICNEQDLIRTFAHAAQVTGRIVAHDARLSAEFDERVTCGHAWTFRPQERHLGQVSGRRLERDLGHLEEGRTYAVLFEARLPVAAEKNTALGWARLTWSEDGDHREARVPLTVPRLPGGQAGEPVDEVERAAASVDDPRRGTAPDAQVRQLVARQELAQIEGRDPALIDALSRRVAVLRGEAPAKATTAAEQQILDADPGTLQPIPPELQQMWEAVRRGEIPLAAFLEASAHPERKAPADADLLDAESRTFEGPASPAAASDPLIDADSRTCDPTP